MRSAAISFKLTLSHLFDILDEDSDSLLGPREALRGLREITAFSITNRETAYVLSVRFALIS
jgi:hypothetical protein